MTVEKELEKAIATIEFQEREIARYRKSADEFDGIYNELNKKIAVLERENAKLKNAIIEKYLGIDLEDGEND